MKKFTLSLMWPAVALMLSGALLSCNKDENRETPEPEPPVEITGENVLFSVSGEVEASSVRAVLFDGDGLFYDAVTPDDTAGKFRVKVPSGDYKAWVVAEADMDADLNALEQGVSTEADFTALAVDRQIADDASVPMVSTEAVIFTCSEETGADLGTVELGRMAARIDIVNAVTDLTVDKVVLKNAVIAGSITGETMPSGDIFEDAACEEEVSGDPESPAVLSLYTYDNLLTDGAHLPSVEITYTFAGEQSVKEFILTDGEQPAALVRGTLYSILLVEDGAELDYSIEGWTSGASVTEYFSLQEAMNRALAVNHFVATNVHSFDFENMTVSFCQTNNTAAGSEDSSWEGNWDASFTGEFTGDDGLKYRLPTLNEMKLFGSETLYKIWWNARNEDDLDNSDPLEDLFGVQGSGGNGVSDYRACSDEDGDRLYGIRFKNTLQQAAYRYETVNIDPDNTYLSVKIKALGMNLPELDEISDESYWEKDYLEFVFPLTDSGNGYYWSGSETTANPDKVYYMSVQYNEVRINSRYKTGAFYNVRMVQVD